MMKAQAFSVFRLLIAAIVAVAILSMLLGIMGAINPNMGRKAEDVAKTLIEQAATNPYTPQEEEATFSSSTVITKKALATRAGLTTDQICFVIPDKSTVTSNVEITGNQLKAKSTGSVTLKLIAICGEYSDSASNSWNLKIDDDTYGVLESIVGGDIPEGLDLSTCFDGLSNGELACVLAVIPAGAT